jgi:hypothetical protein
VHVKDDNEQVDDNLHQITLNMIQATEQMHDQMTVQQPKIRLQRIFVDQ